MNVFYDANGVFQWSSVAAGVALVAAILSIVSIYLNIRNQNKLSKNKVSESIELQRMNEIKTKVVSFISSFDGFFDNYPESKQANNPEDKMDIFKKCSGYGRDFELIKLDLLLLFNKNSKDENNILSILNEMINFKKDVNEYFAKEQSYSEEMYNKRRDIRQLLLDETSKFIQNKYKELKESY